MTRDNVRPPSSREAPGARQDSGAGGGAMTYSQENRKILMVSREPRFSEAVVSYAMSLAERLGYDLVALNVGGGEAAPGFWNTAYRRFLEERFKKEARAAAAPIKARLGAKGLGFEHLVRFGELGKAVEALNREKRRIEFVLNASEMSEAEMMGGVTLPVFTIKGNQGEMIMAEKSGRNLKLAGQTVGWGLATAALYAAVFLNGETVMSYFTRGGWFAALPIATVFLFSYVHGTFSHHVWEALGIQAPKRVVQPQPTAPRPVRRQRPRPRLRLNV